MNTFLLQVNQTPPTNKNTYPTTDNPINPINPTTDNPINPKDTKQISK